MSEHKKFAEAVEAEHRADPYTLFTEIQQTSRCWIEDGKYIVSGYDDVQALFHDPRLSSETDHTTGAHQAPDGSHSIIKLDPPEHDRLRRIMMRQFGPPCKERLVSDLETDIVNITNKLIDKFGEKSQIDVVQDFAHLLPFTIICKLLDIPQSDESVFKEWLETITANAGGIGDRSKFDSAMKELVAYLSAIVEKRKGKDGTDMISGLVNDEGPDGKLPEGSIGPTLALLLIAGHETTVNLIGNGIKTIIENPEEIALLNQDPTRVILLVEEMLRFQPPVQFLGNRIALTEITVGDVVIPAKSTVVLLIAAANRDPQKFECPHQFKAERPQNEHLSFGSGVHSCFGAPLARLEGQMALRLFFQRVKNPRVAKQPSYRPSPVLRGPSELFIAYESILPPLAQNASS